MSTSTPSSPLNSQSQMPLDPPVQKIVDQWVNQINFVMQHANSLKARHIDDAAAGINKLGIKQKEYELFKAKVQAGGYIHKLQTELKKIKISWRDVERDVCDRVGRKPRSLATYRELYLANLNDKYFYENFTEVSRYVAGIRSVTIDETIDINKALDQIDRVHSSANEQILAGKKAGLKVLLENKTKEAGKEDKVNFEAINKVIDSAKDGFDPASIFIQFIGVPVEKWDDLVTKKVLSGHEKIKYDQEESTITDLVNQDDNVQSHMTTQAFGTGAETATVVQEIQEQVVDEEEKHETKESAVSLAARLMIRLSDGIKEKLPEELKQELIKLVNSN